MLNEANESSEARARLWTLVHRELRWVASAKMARESSALTLQPTALVHEAWLRLGGDRQPSWQSRRHFFGAAAEAMRQILIERARRSRAVRHGGGLVRASVEVLDGTAIEAGDKRLVAVSEALDLLAQRDAAKAELVKLRYFVGLTLVEAASAMEISEATAKRWWSFSKAWLARELRNQEGAGA